MGVAHVSFHDGCLTQCLLLFGREAVISLSQSSLIRFKEFVEYWISIPGSDSDSNVESKATSFFIAPSITVPSKRSSKDATSCSFVDDSVPNDIYSILSLVRQSPETSLRFFISTALRSSLNEETSLSRSRKCTLLVLLVQKSPLAILPSFFLLYCYTTEWLPCWKGVFQSHILVDKNNGKSISYRIHSFIKHSWSYKFIEEKSDRTPLFQTRSRKKRANVASAKENKRCF